MGGRQNGFERASVDFAEVLIYGVALTDEDRQAVEMYLEHKFPGSSTIRGDFNNNEKIDLRDIDILTAQSASSENLPQYDLTGDGFVDQADVTEWAKAKDIGYTWIGDANYDGQFKTSDFVQVLGIGKYELPGSTTAWSEGDWNGDGFFDSLDLTVALEDGGYEMGPRTDVAFVPEPGMTALLSSALITTASLWRRSSGRTRRARAATHVET